MKSGRGTREQQNLPSPKIPKVRGGVEGGGLIVHMIIVGDSIAEGLGVAGCSYADLLREGVGESGRERAEVKNLAYTAFQISDSSRLLPEIVQDRPDVMIVAHGITEALLRPPAAALRFVP